MHGKPGEKRENWLLIKGDDEFARSADEADILEERPESINTGRTIDQLEGEAPGWSSKTGKIENARAPAPQPSPNRRRALGTRRTPPRSRARPKPPCPASSSRCWRRWRSLRPPATDGCMRSSSTAIGFKRMSRTARSRSGPGGGLDWTKKFGDAVPQALRNLPVRAALIDGELVVENESGVVRVFAFASGPERRTLRPLRLLRLRLPLSRRIGFARSGAHPPQGAA